MRRNYLHIEEESDIGVGSGGTNEVDLDQQIQQQFFAPKQKNPKPSQRTEQTKQRITQVKSIYLDQMSVQPKTATLNRKKTTIEPKINADDLIKVLQNGKERRNQRKTKVDQIQVQETSNGLRKNFSQNQKLINEHYQTESFTVNAFEVQSAQKKQFQTTTTPVREKFSQKRIIRDMKIEEKKNIRQKDQAQWKQIQNLLGDKLSTQDESQIKKNRRNDELAVAKELLSGKVSIIWVFVLKEQISEEDRNRILKMYSGLSDSKYVAPLVKNVSQMRPFLQIQNSLFKIVSDLQNMTEALRWKINNKVVQFYILNNYGERGIAKALSYKSESRKVKGIYNKLDKIIDRAEQEIENQIQLFHAKNGLSKRKNVKKFPSFMKLSGEDKTYATLYRANLYGSKNLQQNELNKRFDDFMSLVSQKYGSQPKQEMNIAKYTTLNHLKTKIEEKQARQIIRFYVKQSFYYQILNSMLRTMKTTEEFKPCIFPFYENYQAIKIFYKQYLDENKRVIPAQVLYRGAKLKRRDFEVLQPGVFIEMFGFMSTSKNKLRALEFTDRDGYVFVIHVPAMEIPKKFDKYDHGFVDINKYKLADPEFQIEEEILFNALNIYKILKVQNDGEYNFIHMEYGPIFQLLNKEKKKLTSDEKDVLLNYQHCTHLLQDIEDQGDVHLLANQFQQSKEYYEQKLKENANNGRYYYKLANVQQQCGELEEADKNVKASLEIEMKEINLNDREKCLKVFGIHTKNAEISLDKEDYLTADEALREAIELLTDDDEFEKGVKIRQRGEIKFKKGQIREAQRFFSDSENIFRNITKKVQEKRSTVKRRYFFSFFTLFCSATTSEELEEEKQKRLEEIDQLQEHIKNMKEQIDEELIKVNNSMREAAIYAQDKQKYQQYVRKARAYLIEIQARQSNDPREKARLKAMEATVKDYLELAQTENLLLQAIALVEANEPFDPTVGKYSEILATLQKKQCQKFSNPKAMATLKLDPNSEKLVYNEKEHQQVYTKCKDNYQKALNILLYNAKTQSSPEIMSIKNQIGELDFNQSNFESSEKIIRQVKEQMADSDHSQISKSCLLLSKISYARGELKDSFENVEQALRTLRKVLIKKQSEQYEKIFEGHSITLEIKSHRIKIYMKQLQHETCLKDIRSIQQVLDKKDDYSDSHSLLADLMELEGENLIHWKKGGQFDNYFLNAIKLREKQLGKYNLPNAVTYANYAKNLVLAGDFEQAAKMLKQSAEIFGCFSEDHPVTWLLLYCTGLFNERKNNVEESLQLLEKCLSMAMKKFDRSHITINKIRLQYGKILHNAKRFEDAIRQFQELESDLDDELSASQLRNHVECEQDDEKVTVKKFLYSSLRDSYREVDKSSSPRLRSSMKAEISRITVKMDDLRRTYKLHEYEEQNANYDEKADQ